MAGPDPGSFDGVDSGAVPAVAAFEGADPAFASGSPFHGAAEGWSVFEGLSSPGASALAGDDDVADAEVVQGVVDVLLAVAGVGGDDPRRSTGASVDAFDGRRETWGVDRVAVLDIVVEHDAVLVVDQLRLITELDRLAEATFGDGGGRLDRAG
jgi:hypothetical protein